MRANKKSWVFAAVFLGVFVGSARAQEVITANVPFPFVVNHEKLPAGHYSITTGPEGVTAIQSMRKGSRERALGFTTPANGHDPLKNKPALVFARYETGYRLAQIWESGNEGREFQGLSSVRKLARAETQTGASDAEEYVLAANWK